MNKNEFLRQLERELSILDREERKELLDFYEERFYNGIYYEGKTEYQVVEELEPPRVIARNILEQYGIKPNKIKKPEERFKGVSGGSIAWLIIVDVFFLSWLIPGLFSVTIGIFASLLSYIPVFTFIIGEKSQYDIMIFWFLTGFYILLFNFALVILDVFLWTVKRALRFHLNTFKVRKRADLNKTLNKINVDGFIKKRKSLLSIKRLTFIAALLLVGFYGTQLAMNADNIYGLYVNQTSLTETESVDVSDDIYNSEDFYLGEDPETGLDIIDVTGSEQFKEDHQWTIDVNISNMQIVIVESETNEIVITREYQEESDFTWSIDETTRTISVDQSFDENGWTFNIDVSLEEIMRLIKPDVLTIALPEGIVVDDLHLSTLNGSITVSDVTEVNTAELTTMNGRIELSNAKNIYQLNIEGANSRVYIEDSRVAHLDVTTSNGSIIVYESHIVFGDLYTSNGKIKLENLNTVEDHGFSLEVESSNGKIELRNVYTLTVDASTTNGDIYYNNNVITDIDYTRKTTNGDYEGNMN